ncbi:hypothetical protein D3C76_1302120 [compost metagenome]
MCIQRNTSSSRDVNGDIHVQSWLDAISDAKGENSTLSNRSYNEDNGWWRYSALVWHCSQCTLGLSWFLLRPCSVIKNTIG